MPKLVTISIVSFKGHIYSLCQLSGHMFVSGSQDKTARFWDLRASTAITCVPSIEPGKFLSIIAKKHVLRGGEFSISVRHPVARTKYSIILKESFCYHPMTLPSCSSNIPNGNQLAWNPPSLQVV